MLKNRSNKMMSAEEWECLESGFLILQLFKKLKRKKGNAIYRSAVNSLKYEHHAAGEVLYNRVEDGNICSKFYVLLSGSVKYLIHNPNQQQSQQQPPQGRHTATPLTTTQPHKSPISVLQRYQRSATQHLGEDQQRKFSMRLEPCQEDPAEQLNAAQPPPLLQREGSTSQQSGLIQPGGGHEQPAQQILEACVNSYDISPLRLGSNTLRVAPSELQDATILQPVSVFGDNLRFKQQHIYQIVVAQACECAVLSIEKFYKYFYGIVHNDQITYRIALFSQIPLFAQLTEPELCDLIFQAKIMSCNRGQVIYREGDPADSIYVIKTGEFQVYKNTCIDSRDEIEQQQAKATENPLLRDKSIKKRRINVCNLIEGNLFGAEELFSNIPRQNNVEAYQIKSSLFVLSYEKSRAILDKIALRDMDKQQLNKLLNQQHSWRVKQFQQLAQFAAAAEQGKVRHHHKSQAPQQQEALPGSSSIHAE